MSVKTEIKASWQRSLGFNVPQDRMQAVTGSLDQLQHYDENRRVQKYAASYLRSLYSSICGTSFLICLVDPDGWVLSLHGDPKIRRIVEPMMFVPGANWAEQVMGSSGIGISLATAKPTEVLASEHYLRICRNLSCAAAPVMDHQKRLLGVINITTAARDYNPFMLGTVVAAADAIHADLCKPASWMGSDLTSLSIPNSLLQTDPSSFLDQDMRSQFSILPTEQHHSQIRRLNHHQPRVQEHPGDQQTTMELSEQLQQFIPAIYQFSDIIGNSDSMQKAVSRAKRIAQTDDNVLVLGESGSGKELFVHAIHNASSRAQGNLVALNAVTIPPALVASELFGYVGGAFSGARRGGACGKVEMADGGTFFIDEVGEMPKNQQAALLRVLEEHCITRIGAKRATPLDIRVIAASKDDLEAKVQQGKFRDDFLYRLSNLVLRIPPLREHPEDIPLLAQYFAKELAPEREIHFDKEVFKCLATYTWPGNVRELRNVINQALLECKGDLIKVEHLSALKGGALVSTGDLSLQRMEAELIQKAMLASNGDMAQAAKKLGISVSTLYRRRHQNK